MKLYMAGPMFTNANKHYNLRLAADLRAAGFEVFCPNESEPINDKTRDDVTPQKVYEVDITALEDCHVVVYQVSEDSGTNWEAGYMDCLSRRVDPGRWWGVIGIATDMRLQTRPDPAKHGVHNQTPHVNALVAGGLLGSLGVCYDEPTLIDRLRQIRREREGA